MAVGAMDGWREGWGRIRPLRLVARYYCLVGIQKGGPKGGEEDITVLLSGSLLFASSLAVPSYQMYTY